MKRVRLTETQLKSVIKYRLTELGGQKGLWKEEWDKEDQMLAMYNALYGIEEFGMSKQEVAEKIIGTSLGSFVQQSSNFDWRHTGQGLDRPHPLQDEVYEEFKDTPKEEFKRICQEIIDERLQNPPEAVTKKQIGSEIGNRRDEIEKGRRAGFEKLGKEFDPEKHKLVGARPVNPPAEDEPELSTSMKSKEEYMSFLDNILNRLKGVETPEDIQSIYSDIEFAKEYVDAEWMDGETEDMMNEAHNLYLRKTISDIPRIKRVMGL
jgi:hypothetical protein